MSRKHVIIVSTVASLLGLFASAPSLFAAPVHTYGDLMVQGTLESSGGFKFPDGSTLTTSGLNGLLFNVGLVVDNSGSNTGTLNAGAIKFGGDTSTEGIGSQRTSGINQNGLDFYTGSTSRLSILNNGYVGLGTRSPTFPLDVEIARGGATFAKFGYLYPLYLIAGNPHLGFNAYWEGGYKYGDSGPAGYLSFNQSISGGFVFATASSGTANTSAIMDPRMVITNDGKVGVGTTAPAQALDVAGNANVSGYILADSVSATTAVSGAWGGFMTGEAGYYAVSGYSYGSGVTRGVEGTVNSTSGIGGRFTNNATTGKALEAFVNATEVMNVTETGIHAGPGMTGTPLAHSIVGAAGNYAGISHSSNVNAVAHTAGTGVYDIVITGENLNFQSYTAVVGLADSGPGFINFTYYNNGLRVYTYNTSGAAYDRAFTFIIMKI